MRTDDPVLLIIPARGGSKGIPRKNLERLGGLPLIARSVRTALAAELVDHVVVSTDDAEIGAVARAAGAEVVDRPAALSDDTASSESVLLHAATEFERRYGAAPGVIVLLQCTAPFSLPGDIDGVIRLVRDESFDAAFAAAPFSHFIWNRNASGGAVGVNHAGGPRRRRQDLQPQFLEAGSAYAMRFAPFYRAQTRFCGRVGIYEVPSVRCMEIDERAELAVARALTPILDAQARTLQLPDPVGAIAFDFDGVFTDDTALVDQAGRESVRVSRSDGMGIELLRQAGIPMIVISKETNPVVQARCRKVGLPVRQSINAKLPVLKEWLQEIGVPPEECVYVGNDINDRECLDFAGCGVGPADANAAILGSLSIQLGAPAGIGAIRELAEMILSRV